MRVCGWAEALSGLREDWKGFGRKVRRWGRVESRGVDAWRTGRRVRGVAIVRRGCEGVVGMWTEEYVLLSPRRHDASVGGNKDQSRDVIIIVTGAVQTARLDWLTSFLPGTGLGS